MAVVATRYQHIVMDENGVPVIGGTTMKVVELVAERLGYGWSPEELHFQHPYLSMAQVHSALAYYFDHQEELDNDVERRLLEADRIRKRILPSALQARLARGQIIFG
jgi:uncharacterized protein (DUF433 family)